MNRKIFYAITGLSAFALAISFYVFSPYFKEVYNVTAHQRGLIEFPRELPGVIGMFVVAGLAFLGDIRIALFAQILSAIGIWFLGFYTPVYGLMLVLVFINSLGFHVFDALRNSIGIHIAEINGNNIATQIGRFNGTYMAFSMIGSFIAFIGFKTGFFTFQGNIVLPFVIAAIIYGFVVILLYVLDKRMHFEETHKVKFVFRKDYKFYYYLVILFGVQKQIMLVYGPWVLIDLLNKGADVIAIIAFVGAFIGMFFIPFIGRLIDLIGVKKVMLIDALSFIFVYLSYGFFVYGVINGSIPKTGIVILVAYTIIIIDKMSAQLGMVRMMYLKSILKKRSDLTPTLTLGMSMDHVISILAAYTGGIIWTLFGAHYIFFGAAALSLINVYIARNIEDSHTTLKPTEIIE